MTEPQTQQGAPIARCPTSLEGWLVSPEHPTFVDQLWIVEILKQQWPLKAKHTAICQAKAALMRAILEPVFFNLQQAE